MVISRRDFMKLAAVLSGGFLAKSQSSFAQTSYNAPVYGISLAQWSLHKTLFGEGHSARVSGISLDEIKQKLVHTPSYFLRGNLDPLDFPIYSRQKFGIDAVEYVNTFYLGKARDDAYLNELKRRADGEGVQSLLIMCDLEG